MTHRKKILIVSFTNLATDPRVNRQIRFLKDEHSVVCAGTSSPELEDVTYIPLVKKRLHVPAKSWAATRLLLRRFEQVYWWLPWVKDGLDKLRHVETDVVIANDPETLPLALKISKQRPVIFDAHEYSPQEFSQRLMFRTLIQPYATYICRKYIPQTAAMMTVSPEIADRYFHEFGVRPTVLMNTPDYEQLAPQRPPDRGIQIRMIHHGGATRARKLEKLVEMMDHLDDRFELDFMLVESSPGYLNDLKRRAAGNQRVQFLEPVPMRELARTINQYDIGVHLLPPANFGHRYALPNKFFEFIQARLALAIGPSPEMARIVEEHDLGVVAKDFSPLVLAEQLNAITSEDVMRYKSNADQVARRYSAEETRKTLLSVVRSVLEPA